MPQIGKLIFISLEGETPLALNLTPLATSRSTYATVSSSFAPFANTDKYATFVRDMTQLHTLEVPKSQDDITVIYLMGHGWKTADVYTVAAIENNDTLLLSGAELLQRIHVVATGPTILFVDTCNAAALLPAVQEFGFPNLTCITASDDAESASEFGLDRSTRFALTLRDLLNKSSVYKEIEVVQLASRLRQELGRPTLVAAQTVDYWSSGRLLRISHTNSSVRPSRRIRTHLYLRAFFVAAGILVAAAAVTVFLYYRNHIYVQAFAGPLNSINGNAVIEVYEENPDLNQDRLIATQDLYRNGATRLRLPAVDLILVVRANYLDSQPREIRFAIFAASSLSLQKKRYEFHLPSDDEIRAHPRMACMPRVRWLQGSDRIEQYNSQEFWIDLKPVTTEEYLPIARQLVRDGRLEPFLSVLLTEENQSRAVEATNLKQVPKLIGQLQNVFDVINAESRATGQPRTSDTKSLPDPRVPCPGCPAKLTMEEARLYCKSQNKRLPTDLEWELAARGVDARLYPWGNAFDASRANVVGLPDKGQKYLLAPVDAFPNGRSPFGLLDTVGNAGDWIDSRGGYERTFMGGTYRFDKENTLTYSTMPDTGDPLPLMPITCRCVSSP